jgi:autoinducer 2-degrading protein
MFVLTVYLEAKPENLEALKTEASINARATLAEPGALRFDFLQQVDEPTKFMLYEVYRSEEAFQAHQQTDHFKRWVERGVPLLVGERVRMKYQNVEADDEHWR